MRIIILADPLDNQQAGIHFFTRNLVTHLAKVDQENEYFLLRRKKDDLFPADRQIIVKSYSFPGYAAFRMFFLIPLKIRKMKADAVVEPAHFGPFNLPSEIKRIVVIHDLTPILFPHMHRFHSQLLQKIFLKGILKRASLIITNSTSTSKDLAAYYPAAAEKTRQIYLGKDECITFIPDRTESNKITNGRPYFLFAGSIEPRKNLPSLLKAFTRFKQHSGSDHILVIAGGKGWKNKAFFKTLQDHPYKKEIILSGFISRHTLACLYSHAEAFVFPSVYEGFGLPVVEAMACGTPSLISNTSSLPEVGGDAALYFDPSSHVEIANVMSRIVDEEGLKKKLSEMALKQAAKFSWDQYVKTFDTEIKQLFRS